jgi:hypothetical protein
MESRQFARKFKLEAVRLRADELASFLRCRDQGRRPVPNQSIRSMRMKHQRHFGSESDVALREVARISAFIGDLDRVVRILDCDIATEEERTAASDPFKGAYPALARTLAARRENLKRTITALEMRLAGRPDEAEPVRLTRSANNT